MTNIPKDVFRKTRDRLRKSVESIHDTDNGDKLS